jgi:Uma2 family endonuclease
MHEHLLTLEEFEALPDDPYFRHEVSRGRLVREPPPSDEHGGIVVEFAYRLRSYLESHPEVGRLRAESGFLLAEQPLTVRGPDIAFVRLDRPTPDTGYFRGSPDIAVEVVSPSNTAADIQEKVLEYLEAGTALVWVVYPRTHTLVEHRSRSEVRILGADDLLSTSLLPDFALRVADLFAG